MARFGDGIVNINIYKYKLVYIYNKEKKMPSNKLALLMRIFSILYKYTSTTQGTNIYVVDN